MSATDIRRDRDRLRRIANATIAFRRDRAERFGPDLFADPAWELLLAAYISEVEGRRIDLAALAAEPFVPRRVADRWIKILVERGWLDVGRATAPDATEVCLTGSARRALEAHLEQVAGGLPGILSGTL